MSKEKFENMTDEEICEYLSMQEEMKVVICEPNKPARIATIGTSLEAMQELVGGYIEVYCPFDDEACIVCNEEGKISGMKPCRGIYTEDGELVDVVVGTFFICDGSYNTMSSLSDDKLKEYAEKFKSPEKLVMVNGEYKMIKKGEK